MKRPIIATTLSGLFIKKEPWERAHILWYKKAAKKLEDPSLKKWINRKDYFKGVDEIMKRLYPNLNDEQRTIKAREMFFDSVCEYIKQNPRVKNKEIINYFLSLKKKYTLALITTNTKEAVKEILGLVKIDNLFDILETSLPNEKDEKIIVFNRFIKKYGKPLIYMGGNKKDSFDYCKENSINCIFVNSENEEEIKNIKSVHNLKELKEVIEKF
jgi:hypothetical protein